MFRSAHFEQMDGKATHLGRNFPLHLWSDFIERSRRGHHQQFSHTRRVHAEPRRNHAAAFTDGRRGNRQACAAHLSNSGISTSEPEISRPLLTTDEAVRLPEDAALVFSTGMPTAWANKLRYYKHPEFGRRAQIPPPEASDRLREVEGSAISPEANHRGESVSPAPTLNDSAKSVQDVSDSARLL
jgi:type IV secretory system conjugative DNA transfer VirD4/TraG family protein